MPAASARVRKQSNLLSKTQNLPFEWKILCFTRAGPRGLEPRKSLLESDSLPLAYGPKAVSSYRTMR